MKLYKFADWVASKECTGKIRDEVKTGDIMADMARPWISPPDCKCISCTGERLIEELFPGHDELQAAPNGQGRFLLPGPRTEDESGVHPVTGEAWWYQYPGRSLGMVLIGTRVCDQQISFQTAVEKYQARNGTQEALDLVHKGSV
jgi:hypothetical protein